MVEKLPPGDVNICTDYIIPAIGPLASDPNTLVRGTLAKCIARLAETSLLFLELFEDLKNDPALDLDMETNIYHMTYDASLKELHDLFQEIILILLTDNNASVKKNLLPDITRLCIFFGRPRASEALVSHLITYFNDADWTLRSDFCESIVGISTFIGPQGFNEFLLPLLIMALTDPQEFVVERVVSTMATLTELGLINRNKLKELAKLTGPLLIHPNEGIRQGTYSYRCSFFYFQYCE